ncbi:MAG: hypothetical protein ABJA35_14045 [Parafilimonas sp.]
MLPEKNKELSVQFLKSLSKVKGWNYNEKTEMEKKFEIKEFISFYVLRDKYSGIPNANVSFNRLSFFVEHPTFKPAIKALLILLELSRSEKEFEEWYQKMHIDIF